MFSLNESGPKKKTLGQVAAELMVMYSWDRSIQERADFAKSPADELIVIGREREVHDIPEGDERLNGIGLLLDELLYSKETCVGT